jgi:Kdo2-lipid IVA lauroyltransferase/acyltransferase
MANVGTRLALRFRRLVNVTLGFFAVGTIKTVRLFNINFISDFSGALMRWLGPWLPEHRIGRENLVAAFPDKSAAEIEEVLRGAWDNLGRFSAEFAHIDRLWDYDISRRRPPGRVMDSDESEAILLRLRDDGKPALIFAAHLANWELAAIGAASYGVDTTVLYRRPNLRAVSDLVTRLRSRCMGTLIPTGLDAPVKLAEALQRGSHVAILVDQYYGRGVPVTFFGRTTVANPLIARLARQIECPVHGARVVRHPGHRFQVRMTGPITLPRDAEGKIDIAGSMQVITDVVESWVREHPEQWLWQHRRWR